jgi:cobalt-zinc-cadmium efflux system outer membrane protein
MRPLLAKAVLLSCAASGLLAGCASVDPAAGFPDVQSTVQERLGKRIRWFLGKPEDAEVEQAIRNLLKEPLTVDAAVEIALLSNRSLQATYEELGVAQADLVQAGLLRNPVLFASARFPTTAPKGTNIEVDVSQSFLELLFLPARKDIAALEFEQAKLRVAHAVLDLAAETRSAYYGAVGARQIADMRKVIAQATEASALFAQRLYEAGNTTELAMTLERASHEQSRQELAKAESDVVSSRERLTKLLGLWGGEAQWKAPPKLPDVPNQEMPLDQLESLAVSRRLDLALLREEVRSLSAGLALAGRVRWFGELTLGVDGERESDHHTVIGPNLSVQLPIFDQGQATLARLEAFVRQREDRLAALAVNIRAEVRSLRDRLMLSRYRIEHLLKVVIPLRERAVALTQEQWNFMLVGAFELIESKRREFEAYHDYIDAVRDYWITKSDLVRALGGNTKESNAR